MVPSAMPTVIPMPRERQVDLADGDVGIAEEGGEARDFAALGVDADAVAEFENGVVAGEQVDVAPADAADDGTKLFAQVEGGDRFADDFGVGDKDAARGVEALVGEQVFVGAFAEVAFDLVEGGFGAGDDDEVTFVEAGVAADEEGVVVALDSAENNLPTKLFPQLTDGDFGVLDDFDGAVGDFLIDGVAVAEGVGFGRKIDFPEPFKHTDGRHAPDHADGGNRWSSRRPHRQSPYRPARCQACCRYSQERRRVPGCCLPRLRRCLRHGGRRDRV